MNRCTVPDMMKLVCFLWTYILPISFWILRRERSGNRLQGHQFRGQFSIAMFFQRGFIQKEGRGNESMAGS